MEMDETELKETHPQKYYFKMICKLMYYLGLGDCWYETEANFRLKKKLYKTLYVFWQIVSIGFILVVVLNELLAHLRTDLNEKEKNDLMQFSIAQPLVTCKVLALYWKRERIKVVIKQLLEGTRSLNNSLEVERSSMKQAFRYCLVYAATVYLTLIPATFDAIRIHIKTGAPISTEVVLYPTPSSKGTMAIIARCFVEYHWYHLMGMMLTADSIVVFALIVTKCKFQLVHLHFQSLNAKLSENPERKSQRELEEDFRNDFIRGIKMHEDALWCASNVQSCMGVICSIQILESVILLAVCVVKFVAGERSPMYIFSYFAFIACLVVLTGFYMITAGDITYEASLVPTAIFHCGWELLHDRLDFRVLVVVALQRSQVPVCMTAFGVIQLSYTNFISVLRSSYSFFALVY